MIKYYCDLCGKEVETLADVKIPTEYSKIYGNIHCKTYGLCEKCCEAASKIEEFVAKTRIDAFAVFLKGEKTTKCENGGKRGENE